jgi:oligopeptide transport system permease protein
LSEHPPLNSGLLYYALRRLAGAIPLLLMIVALAFVLIRFAPGGPFDDEQALPAPIRANLERAYGFDRPLPAQFVRYAADLLQGDFGPSMRLRDFSVAQLIGSGLPVSATLGVLALLVAGLLGVPLGILAALHHNRLLDHLLTGAAVLGTALPACVMAPLLALIFGVYLGWLPVAGWSRGTLIDLVLPVTALALPLIATVARLMRSSLLEVLALPYLRTARAKGLSLHQTVRRHALRAALLPILSYLGPASAYLLTGSLVVETLFGLPGMGRYLVQGALNRDYTLVMGMVVVYAAILIALNLLVDLLYGVLDPRVRQALR